MTDLGVPDAALEADIAILGKKGMGKTYAAKGLVERLLDMGRRVIVLDPLSTWWGLKAGAAGYAIPVLGGPHADLPLTDQDGAALGRYLAESQGSAVLDLGSMRKAEVVRFATQFFEELYTFNRDPLWLVLEEADVFAPQQPMNDTARLLGEVDRIARRGRQFGFRLISLTQRPARLAKDVLTQLSTLIVLGITSPQDRDAVKAWVEGNADRDQAKSVVDSLASLHVGEGWIWAPALELLQRVAFPPIKTPDTSATPKAGAATPKAKVRTDIDIAALRAALASTDREETASPEVTAVTNYDPTMVTAAERRAYEAGVQAAADYIRSFSLEWKGRATSGDRTLLETSDKQPVGAIFADAILELLSGSAPARAGTAIGAEAPKSTDTMRSLSPTAQRIIDVVKEAFPVSLTFDAAAKRAGASKRSSAYRQFRREVIESGAVELSGERLTAVGGEPSASGASQLQIYAAKLQPSWSAMLMTLAGSSIPLSREDVADRSQVSRTSSNLGAGLRGLRAMELIEELPDGRFQLNPALRAKPGSRAR